MQFRLTYEGKLLATRSGPARNRSVHKHDVRKDFHRQLKRLWAEHPVLSRGYSTAPVIGSNIMDEIIPKDGFHWKPLVTSNNGLICSLDILMLRTGQPGAALQDIDNRLKTIFDALRMAKDPNELGAGTEAGMQSPGPDENPFFVLVQDDALITHVSVSTDMLLKPVDGIEPEQSVRLVITVTARPYAVRQENLELS